MSDIAIRVENLSKQYRIGAKEIQHDTLMSAAVAWVKSPLENFRQLRRLSSFKNGDEADVLWALRDVSFTVKQGEVIGIIGRNGAGKSTLLKILSRITPPSAGRIILNGRVASLLEIGTGFHPELTGRENIYLNGTILGMTKAEVDQKFAEIVDFSGVEKFVDTAVKRYSSGMRVRLAFSVAVHLEPEILLIDEVLAVGDAQFQQQCFRKMQDASRGGRTILFVSHNMSALRQICEHGLLLEKGKIVLSGEANEVADHYLASTMYSKSTSTSIETQNFTVHSVNIYSLKGHSVIKTFDPVTITVRFTPKVPIADPGVYAAILTPDGQRLTALDFKDFSTIDSIEQGAMVEMGFKIAELALLPGSYYMEIFIKDMAHHVFEQVQKSFPFEVVESPVYGGRHIDRWYGNFGLHAEPYSRIISQDDDNWQTS